VHDRGTHAGDLVGRDAYPDARAADAQADLGVTGHHRTANPGPEFGVVDRLVGVGPEVDDLVALLAQMPDQVVLELETGVVGADDDPRQPHLVRVLRLRGGGRGGCELLPV